MSEVNVVAEIRASLPIICRGSGRNSRADHSDEDYLQVHREIAEKWITEIERREALQPNLVSLIVCQQLNSRREELETEVERLRAREASILKLHTAVRIYQDCGRNGDCDNAHIAEDSWPESDFLTCEEGYEYEICFGCCTDGDNNQTRTCVECHDHNAHKPRCGTFALLTNPQGDTL